MRYEPEPEPTVQDVTRFVARNFDKIEMEKVAFMAEHRFYAVRRSGQSDAAFVTAFTKEKPVLAMVLFKERVFVDENLGNIIDLMKVRQKVPAIKKIRQGYGLGLKEAKDIADKIQDELFARGQYDEPYKCVAEFKDTSELALNEIMEYLNERNPPDAVDERQSA